MCRVKLGIHLRDGGKVVGARPFCERRRFRGDNPLASVSILVFGAKLEPYSIGHPGSRRITIRRTAKGGL
jgi:hypothetical protein